MIHVLLQLTARSLDINLFARVLTDISGILERNANYVSTPFILNIVNISERFANFLMLRETIFTIAHSLFVAPRPECTTDPECPDHLACIREKCQNPCHTTTCGINAECKAKNHRAICICLIGYVGDPYTVCEERKIIYCLVTYICLQLIHRYYIWKNLAMIFI